MDNNNEQKIAKEENSAVNEINGIKNENVELEKKLMEKMVNQILCKILIQPSSSSVKEKASDNVINLEEKVKKRIKFGGWLQQTLDWIKRTELAQSSLCTSSSAFEPYWWPNLHGWKVKPHIVPSLPFSRERDADRNWQTILEKNVEDDWLSIPIANINPPDYIIGFDRIFSRFINENVFQFVQKIFPLLKEVEIRYVPNDENNPKNGLIRQQMMSMLAPKTSTLAIYDNEDGYNLSKFNEQYPGFIDGVQSLNVCVFEEMALDLTLELKWLSTPREDGKPKMLDIYAEIPLSHVMKMDLLIDCVKEEFVHSTEPAKFIIRIFKNGIHDEPIAEFEDFKIENETTGEILELKCKEDEEEYFLIRHKNGDEIPKKIDDLEEQFDRKIETKLWFDVDLEKFKLQ